MAWSQVRNTAEKRFQVRGSVQSSGTRSPISGVEISTDRGAFTITNSFGEFKIEAVAGDQLIVESPDFETIRYTIRDDEDIAVLVEGLEGDDPSTGFQL